MAVRVGSAYFDIAADLRPLDQSLAEASRRIQRFNEQLARQRAPLFAADAKQAAADAKQAAADDKQAAADAKRLSFLARIAEAEARNAAAVARRTQAENAAAISAGRVAVLDQRRATEAARTAAADDRAAVAALRRSQAEQRAARQAQNGGLGPALPRTFAGFTAQGLGQAAGAFGLATFGPQVVSQIISYGVAQTQAALALRETKNSLAAIAGDQRVYNQILSEARAQQVAFGGSLQENIDGLQGLAVSARAGGADLTQLIDLQRRLTVLDPAQGAQGARIALNEALSGNIASLSRRFEIPRDQLRQLSDTSLPVADRLKAIDTFLNKVGITSAAVASKIDQDAAAFRSLGQQLETAGINAGNKLASGLSQSAEGLSRLLGVINSDPEAIAKLIALSTGQPVIGGPGGTADQIKAVLAQQGASDTLNNGVTGAAASGKLGDAKAQAEQLLTLLNFAGERSAAAGQQATNAFIQTNQSASDYIATLQRLVAESQSQQTKQQQLNDALGETTKKSIDAKIQAQQLADYQRQLDADSKLAAQGLLGAGDQAALLAQKYNFAAGQAQFLIDQQQKILAQGAKASTAARRPGPSSADGLRALAEGRQTTAQDIAESQARYDRLLDSRDRLALSAARTSAERIAIYKRQLARATTEEDRNAIQAQINGELQTRTGGAVSTANKLNDIAIQSGADRLRIERENLERLHDQHQDYELRRTRSQEDYERQRRRLLAEGKRAEAARLAEQFAIEQRRAAEDFAIQRGRTLRNNSEGLGDQSTRVGIQTAKATRGRGGAATAGGAGGAAAAGDAGGAGGGSMLLRVEIAPTQLQINGETIVNITWPAIEQRVVADLANVGITVPPGSGQAVGVSGPRP